MKLAGLPPGYPVVFDVNMRKAGVEQLQQYLDDGQYLDSYVDSVQAEVVVFNPELSMLGTWTSYVQRQPWGVFSGRSDISEVQRQVSTSVFVPASPARSKWLLTIVYCILVLLLFALVWDAVRDAVLLQCLPPESHSAELLSRQKYTRWWVADVGIVGILAASFVL